MAKSLKGQTKKAIQENKVQQLDNFGSSIDDFIQEQGLSVIENVVGDFIVRVKDNIESEKGMITTGSIANIEVKAEDGYVNVYANPWLIYQDRGVNGSVNKLYNTPHSYKDKMPPVQVFKDWIKDKNIRLIDNEKYYGDASPFKELSEDAKITKAAWGMATKVFQDGFKPRNIYSKEIPQLLEDLQEQVADFAIQSIIQMIDVKPSAKRVIR